jgi:hypothetical protein
VNLDFFPPFFFLIGGFHTFIFKEFDFTDVDLNDFLVETQPGRERDTWRQSVRNPYGVIAALPSIFPRR